MALGQIVALVMVNKCVNFHSTGYINVEVMTKVKVFHADNDDDDDDNNDATTSKDMQIGNYRGVKANSPPGSQGSAGLPDDLQGPAPHHQDAVMGFPCASRPRDRDGDDPGQNQELRMLNACSPDGSTEADHKALVGNQDVLNVPPARAGNSTDIYELQWH